MNKRLIVYFHYDPRGQVDSACRFAVQALARCGDLFFVTNGTLEEASRRWVGSVCFDWLERPNTGFDVGAYRDALCRLGRPTLDRYAEIVLMNYTLAGPVLPVERMFETMDRRTELDFWGLTRHYAMKSRRFGGQVPEHLQSHFLAVRPRMMEDFWNYWQTIRLPSRYEESVICHETRFTPYFAARGYRWDSYVDTGDLAAVFVNPIMACPAELIRSRGCPFFKRRSFFTPYGDELRRTDGQAAAELYRYLREQTTFPVQELVASLLPVQPLTNMAQNLHWQFLLPEKADGELPRQLNPDDLRSPVKLDPDGIYFLPLPQNSGDAVGWYLDRSIPDETVQRAAAALLRREPWIGVLGPALPLFPACLAEKQSRWHRDLPYLRQRMEELHLKVPLEERQALPLPNGGGLFLRAEAFPQGLPAITQRGDLWLLPLIAQYNGRGSAVYETASQSLARGAVLEQCLYNQMGLRANAKNLARSAKAAWRERKGENGNAG